MNVPLAIVGTVCGATAVYLTVRFINRPSERSAILGRVAVFIILAVLPLFVRVFVKRDLLINPVYEVLLRAFLIYFGLVLAGIHLAISLVAALIRRRRLPVLWEAVLLLPFVALSIFSGYYATVTVPAGPAPITNPMTGLTGASPPIAWPSYWLAPHFGSPGKHTDAARAHVHNTSCQSRAGTV